MQKHFKYGEAENTIDFRCRDDRKDSDQITSRVQHPAKYLFSQRIYLPTFKMSSMIESVPDVSLCLLSGAFHRLVQDQTESAPSSKSSGVLIDFGGNLVRACCERRRIVGTLRPWRMFVLFEDLLPSRPSR